MTAVEWLGNEITNRITRRNTHDTIIIQTLGEVLIELIEQAKEMERQQIIQSHEDAYLDCGFEYSASDCANDYYNKKFKL